jgi:hypothetical protein
MYQLKPSPHLRWLQVGRQQTELLLPTLLEAAGSCMGVVHPVFTHEVALASN